VNAEQFLEHRRDQEAKHFRHADPKEAISALQAIEINVTELCNRTCEFCPRAHGYPNQNINLCVESARSLAKNICESLFTGRISFSGFGEAILNKDVPEILKLFRSYLPSSPIETNSNGDRLTIESIQSLFAAGLSNNYVNMYDGPEQEAYFKDLFWKAGETRYTLRPHWQGAEESWGLKLTNRAGSIPTKLVQILPMKRQCYYPFYKMFIDHNGDVLACCNDWKRAKKLGNAFKQSIKEIWTGEALEDLREKLANADRSEEPCKSCDADGLAYGAQSYLMLRRLRHG
jgi:radical SAM protein with 4Fe4S-binding SPASM domain